MQFNKLGYISAAFFSIGLSAEMTICYAIKNNWVLFLIHLLITFCIIYICLMINSLKLEINKINEIKLLAQNIPANYNPILENDLLEV
jgi:hypothetical protein